MNKKLKLGLTVIICLIVSYSTYLVYDNLNKVPTQNTVSNQTITYFISPADPADYCNGVDMDSTLYQKTITTKKVTTTATLNPTKTQLATATIDVATTGTCRSVMSQLDISVSSGTVYISPISAWAGSSIAMCSCKPQVEVNVLQIPGITKIVWETAISNFEECMASGNPILESYPRQCRYKNKTFVENIGNELQKINLIRLDTPRPNQVVSSPLTIKGQARGSWFFEASFPIILTDWDGKIIAQGNAQTENDWMTNDFLPFNATLKFTVDKNAYSNKGTLILRKDNPSGLSKYDDALEIPVIFTGTTNSTTTVCTQEAKLCPNGSYVGRTGPNCAFAKCAL